jgi:hypothetical protein
LGIERADTARERQQSVESAENENAELEAGEALEGTGSGDSQLEAGSKTEEKRSSRWDTITGGLSTAADYLPGLNLLKPPAEKAEKVEPDANAGLAKVRFEDTGNSEDPVEVTINHKTGEIVDAKDAKALAAEEFLDNLKETTDLPGRISAVLDNLDNVKDMALTRNRDGGYHLDTNFENVSYMAPPNVTVKGRRPNVTRVDRHVSLDLNASKENKTVSISNIHGMTGSVTGGLLNRTRPTATNAMKLGHDRNGKPYLDTTSTAYILGARRSSVRLNDCHFDQHSPMKQLLSNSDQLSQLTEALGMFKESDIAKLSLQKNGENSFEAAIVSDTAKHIEMNQQLEGTGSILKAVDLDKSISASISHGADGVTLDKIKGITMSVESKLLGEMKLSLTRLSLKNGPDGKPMVHMDFCPPGKPGSNIPIKMALSKLLKRQ